MIELLAKVFIRDADNLGNARVRAAYGTLCLSLIHI